MFQKKMYKSYYPLRSYLDIHAMPASDRERLIRDMKRFKMEVDCYNYEAAGRSVQIGLRYYDRVRLLLDVGCAVETMKTEQYSNLTEEEIHYMNMILYRNKYVIKPPMRVFLKSWSEQSKGVLEITSAAAKRRKWWERK